MNCVGNWVINHITLIFFSWVMYYFAMSEDVLFSFDRQNRIDGLRIKYKSVRGKNERLQ